MYAVKQREAARLQPCRMFVCLRGACLPNTHPIYCMHEDTHDPEMPRRCQAHVIKQDAYLIASGERVRYTECHFCTPRRVWKRAAEAGEILFKLGFLPPSFFSSSHFNPFHSLTISTMKFAVASAALAASVAATSVSESVSYDLVYVTNNVTTEVTITSCSDNKCATTVSPVAQTTVTTTVEGVETVYTTYCPLTASETTSSETTSSEESSLTTVTTTVEGVETVYTTYCPITATESASSDSVEYVDVTTTPTVTTSVGVESTTTAQSTFTSVYNSTSSVAAVSSYVGGANRNAVAGAVGIAGVAALLL